MKYLRVFLFGVLLASLITTGVVMANRPDEPMKPTSVVVSKPKEKVKPIKNESVVEAAAPVVEAPRPVIVEKPTVRVLFEMESSNTYPHNTFRPLAVESPSIKPAGAWNLTYDYTCNPGTKILMYRLSEKGFVVNGWTVTNSDSPTGSNSSGSVAFLWKSEWVSFNVLVFNQGGCTWHVKATEPI